MTKQDHIDNLGKKCHDIVTGMKGVIVSVSFDLYGCIQYAIQPPAAKGDNQVPNSFWFDENRVLLETKRPVMPSVHHSDQEEQKKTIKGPAEKPCL